MKYETIFEKVRQLEEKIKLLPKETKELVKEYIRLSERVWEKDRLLIEERNYKTLRLKIDGLEKENKEMRHKQAKLKFYAQKMEQMHADLKMIDEIFK